MGRAVKVDKLKRRQRQRVLRTASVVTWGRPSPSLPCVTLVSSSLCRRYFKNMRFSGVPIAPEQFPKDEKKSMQLLHLARSQGAKPACTPFSSVSLPCLSGECSTDGYPCGHHLFLNLLSQHSLFWCSVPNSLCGTVLIS